MPPRHHARRRTAHATDTACVTDLARRLAAEALGTATLVAAVVGSGIMAERLTEDVALALLCNSIATGAILIVLIAVLAPLSGAHFNPAVSLVFALRRELPAIDALLYVLVQVATGIAGALVAHAMFELPLVSASVRPRTGGGQWLSEAIAAFGLILVILGGVRVDRRSVPWLVGLFIASAYWFTASTSFANPAVTVARALTDSFSGIRLIDVAGFIAAQVIGALCAWITATWLLAGGTRSAGQEQR
jgi:glycerol uptake facilitator-like aquaporin